MLGPKTKIIRIINFINVLVTTNPVEGVYAMARTIGDVSLGGGA